MHFHWIFSLSSTALIQLNQSIPPILMNINQSIIIEMKALKCKPSAQFAHNYSISVLRKCSSIISHRSSIFEGRHVDLRKSATDHQSSKVDTSIIDLRRSTHRSSKVDTSIFEGQHIDLRKSTSIFKGRHIDL